MLAANGVMCSTEGSAENARMDHAEAPTVSLPVYEPASGVAVTEEDGSSAPLGLLGMTACLLVAEFLALAFWAPPLFDPDESLFAVISREMSLSGDYVTPRYRGEPFFDRPAPYFWLLAAATNWLGESDFAYRLPGFLMGIGTVVFVGLIARDLYGPTVGAASALVAATLAPHPIQSFAVTHDGALVFFVTAAVWAVLRRRLAEGASRRYAYALVAGILLGGACLSKGLLGFVLPVLAVGPVVIASGRWAADWRVSALQWSVALAVAGPWYLAMQAVHPGYLTYFFFERHLLGFLGGTQRHGDQSVLVYLPTLALGSMPWILLCLAPLVGWRKGDQFRSRVPENRVDPGVLGWLVLTVAFFLVAGSRNPTYMLPAFPPFAILAGRRLAGWIGSRSASDRRTDRVVAWLPAATVVCFALAIPASLWRFQRPISEWWLLLPILCAMGAVALLQVRRLTGFASQGDDRGLTPRDRLRLLSMQTFITAASIGLVVKDVLPEIARQRTALPIVQALRQLDELPEPILWFNHLPPSALLYGPEFRFERVFYVGTQRTPLAPTAFVSRESRLVEVLPTPLVDGARHIDLRGKFHLFLCGPWHDRLADREVTQSSHRR